MPDEALIDAFADRIRENRDADEFERLMVGGKEPDVMGSVEDNLDLIDLTLWGRDPSALAELKASRALERLQSRYPELWEQAVMSEGVEV